MVEPESPEPQQPGSRGVWVVVTIAIGVIALGCWGTVQVLGWALMEHAAEMLWLAAAVAALVGWIMLRVWWRRGGRNAVRRALGIAPGVEQLARRLDVTPERLRGFSPFYREVRIPKRSGGVRVLHVPDANTKELQRRILRRLLARLKSHRAAYGFEPGRSIAHHAAQHTRRAIVLHFDVVDFFPSTRAARIEAMFLRLGWNREAVALLTKLTTYKGGLPQGAPTSPRLSNLVNFGLDAAIASRVGVLHGRYSRYADDITVSFPEDHHRSVERTKSRVMHELCRRGYRMHLRKKHSVRRAYQRQVVTGLVVNDKVALPRTLRRKLRAARHHIATGRPATWTEEQLRGWAAFEEMVREQGSPPPETGTSRS